ncbi:hypothetical protein QQF64_013771 [Cirrhinus molitorella]|uniref:Uncharacterized protein n=1 Tax=Cirrhinus molitorella TaxID=172907 RepID=A0ABR3LS54_9TELE
MKHPPFTGAQPSPSCRCIYVQRAALNQSTSRSNQLLVHIFTSVTLQRPTAYCLPMGLKVLSDKTGQQHNAVSQ